MIKNSTRNIFAKNLSYYAGIKGINQSEISSRIGCSSSTVSDWFSGKKYPRPDKMQKLSEILGVYISDLINDKKEEPPINDEKLSDERKYLIDLVMESSDEEVKRIYDLLLLFLKNK